MNIEEQLRQSNQLLKQLLSHTSIVEEGNKPNQEEIDDIEEAIEKYEAEVEELKSKLANEDNYKRDNSKSKDFDLNERPFIESLIADSISEEREDIFKSNQLYRKQQEQQNKMLSVYNGEIVKLKGDIENIEARLKKDSIAKKNGVVKKMHLSDSEVADLQLELNYKKELVEEGQQVIEICIKEIQRYETLIVDNNNRLKALTFKEQKLSDVIIGREQKAYSEIDRYQICLDKDELYKRISGLEALKKRKEFLLYNPSEEIKKQISQNEEFLKTLQGETFEVGKQNDVEEETKNFDIAKEDIVDEKEDLKPDISEKTADTIGQLDNDAIENTISDDNAQGEEVEEQTNDNEFKPMESERSIVVAPDRSIVKNPEKVIVKSQVEEIVKNHEEEIVESPESEEEKVDDTPEELVDIYDAPQELKEQKLSDRIKTAWHKWRDKAITLAMAAAITITSGSVISKLSKGDSKETTSSTNITSQDNLSSNSKEDDNFTFAPGPSVNEPSNEINNEEIKAPEINTPVVPNDPVIEKPVIEQIKKEEPKVEFTSPSITDMPTTTPEIPEVEVEAPYIKPQIPQEEIKVEQTKEETKLEGVINNSEIETTVLQSEGEFVDILLKNGEYVCVKYGDNGENVPSDVTIKYDGTDMYIYSPIVTTKTL